jgi:hypothetical protein
VEKLKHTKSTTPLPYFPFNTMNITELREYRLNKVDTPSFNMISGIVHIIWFLLDSGTLLLWIRNARFKKKITGNYKGVSKGARLIMWITFCTSISELGYFGLLPSFFSRAGGVVGNDEYDIDQFGYLNSDSTIWCSLTSYFLYWGLSSMITATWLLMRHVYLLAIKTGQKGQSSLDHDSCIMSILHNPSYVIAVGIPIIGVLLQGTMSQQGPMGAYCGIRCHEYGIDEVYTSKDRCYVRLIAFYWLCLTFGPVVLFDAYRLLRHIHKVHQMSIKKGIDQGKLKEMRERNKNKGSRLMRRRLTRFAVVISIAMFGASILRIGSSMNPDPMKEGTNGMTEYFGLVISPFMVGTFSIGLWLDFFGLSATVSKTNEKFARRNSFKSTTSHASSNGRNSNLGRKSDLSLSGSASNLENNYVKEAVDRPLPPDSTSSGTNVEDSSSMSTVPQIVNSPSATPSKYAASSDSGVYTTSQE